MMFDRLRKIFPREEESVNNANNVQPIAHSYELKLEKFFSPIKRLVGCLAVACK